MTSLPPLRLAAATALVGVVLTITSTYGFVRAVLM